MVPAPRGPSVNYSGRPVVTPVRVVIGLCLLAPFVAMLWVGSYAKTDPVVIGIPFFYWYQMLWVLISTVLTMVAYKLWQRDQRARSDRKGGAEQ
ncbi:Membrane protein implicated in regulation of membrane protease activity OS=Streptomyces albaduncus OX=68172 GN=FHS32_004825 PE=4 SV=1 [Streptomyces griseoloalbus]